MSPFEAILETKQYSFVSPKGSFRFEMNVGVNSPISTSNEKVNPLLSDQSTDRSIADHCVLGSEAREFDRSESGTLLVRTGLGKVGMFETGSVMEGSNDT